MGIRDRLQEVLVSWLGTPYREGQCVKGMGCNCVFLGAGVLDELFGMEDRRKVPVLDPEVSVWNDKKSWSVVRAMRTLWHGSDEVDFIEPGDLLVCRGTDSRTSPANPGHLMIASADPNIIFETSKNLGVYSTRLSHARPVIRIYRPRRKDLWNKQN